MVAQDPVIIVTGGSAKVKLGNENFHAEPKREYDDPNAKIIRVVVQDSAGKELQTFSFPDGKFEVKFYGEKKNNDTNP